MSALDLAVWRRGARLVPPVCNKLIHRGQLTVMAVGGPNARKDFHLQAGAEFFWQHQGTCQLPIVEHARRRLVHIPAGHVFLLPPRVPHSPQRSENSFGIVVERDRAQEEMDVLRWYTDFDRCDTILWEKEFKCTDLGRDLIPVIEEFRNSEQAQSGSPNIGPTKGSSTLDQDHEVVAGPSFPLQEWLAENALSLSLGRDVPIFSDVASRDIHVAVQGGASEVEYSDNNAEMWLFQLQGTGHVTFEGSDRDKSADQCIRVESGSFITVPRGRPFRVVAVDGRSRILKVHVAAGSNLFS